MAYLIVPTPFDQHQHWEITYQTILDKIRSDERGPLAIDLGLVTFLPAEGVLVLVNIARLWYRHSGEITLLEQVQRPVLQYLERMDAFSYNIKLVAADPLPASQCWERSITSTNLLELQSIASVEANNAHDVSRTVTRARSILATWLRGDTLRMGRLCTMLAELASNIVHSNDQGFAIIQRYTGTRSSFSGSTVIIAIADLGIGIEASLRCHSKKVCTDELHRGSDYILHALKLGISSRNTVAGIGLFQIQQQILDASGTLAIRSQHSQVVIDNGTLYVQDNLVGQLAIE